VAADDVCPPPAAVKAGRVWRRLSGISRNAREIIDSRQRVSGDQFAFRTDSACRLWHCTCALAARAVLRSTTHEEGWFDMTTFTLRSLAIGTLAILMCAGNGAAQSTSPVLNTLELQRLVGSSEPGDHATLSAHFASLADSYARDARTHAAMATAFRTAPTLRAPANNASDHCKRLAHLSEQSADTLRKLAAYHERLAGGAVSTPPRDAARFHSGEGAPEPTSAELTALAAKAATPTDHRTLEEYFSAVSRRYTADAADHIAMAQAYRGTRIAQAADHCERLVKLSRDAAKQAIAAAAMHGQLASVAQGTHPTP
jgi:hypothetical protein